MVASQATLPLRTLAGQAANGEPVSGVMPASRVQGMRTHAYSGAVAPGGSTQVQNVDIGLVPVAGHIVSQVELTGEQLAFIAHVAAPPVPPVPPMPPVQTHGS